MSQGSSGLAGKGLQFRQLAPGGVPGMPDQLHQEVPHLVHRLRHLGGEGIGREVRVTDDLAASWRSARICSISALLSWPGE